MNDRKYLNCTITYFVRNDVWIPCYDQFPCVGYPANPAEVRMVGKYDSLPSNLAHHLARSRWVVLGDVLRDAFYIGERGPAPSNAHLF